MIENEHAKMVEVLSKSGEALQREQNPTKLEFIHHCIGVSTEAGELLDAAKKAFIYCQAPNLENIIEELGDLEFYMQGVRMTFGITREETLRANMEKLAKRYERYKYSDQQAKERKDKNV